MYYASNNNPFYIMENKINVLNTDLNIFNQFLPNENLTHYFKTKNNFLRIAFFSNNYFIVIETPKGLNMFENLVLKQDSNNLYSIMEKKEITNSKNILQYNIYIGNINI